VILTYKRHIWYTLGHGERTFYNSGSSFN